MNDVNSLNVKPQQSPLVANNIAAIQQVDALRNMLENHQQHQNRLLNDFNLQQQSFLINQMYPHPAQPKQDSGNDNLLLNDNLSTYHNFLKDFKTECMDLLVGQHQMLMKLKEKSHLLQETLSCLNDELANIK